MQTIQSDSKLAQLSIELSGEEDNELIRDLRRKGYSDTQIEEIIESILSVCRHCWNNDRGCRCWDDE